MKRAEGAPTPTSAQDWVTVWEEHLARLHLSERERDGNDQKTDPGSSYSAGLEKQARLSDLAVLLNGCGQVLVRGQGRWTMV